LGEALVEAGKASRDVVVLDADTPRSTGTLAFAEAFPDRFFNLGISEQDLVGTAAGLAVAGKTPVAAAFAVFLMRAWEQIRNTVARDGLNVKLVGTHSGLSDYMDGSSHQCLEDIALTRVLPGFTVVVPADTVATKKIVLEAVLEHRGPVYIRLGRDNAPRIYDSHEEFPLGGSKTLRDAVDVVLFSYGPMLGVALEAARRLGEEGVSAGVVDVYTLKPVDVSNIVRQAKRVGLVVTVEDHSVYGGLGSIVAEVLAEHLPRRLLRIGVRDRFGASSRSYVELLEYMGLTPDKVASRVLEVFRRV
jgi:transketolase